MAANLSDLCSRYDKLKSDRSTWDSWWQDLGNFVSPRKAEITSKDLYPSDTKETSLYDATAVQANMTLGQGQLAYCTPMEERWFACEPPDDMQSDAAFAHYAKCGEIMAIGLANSNAYTELHEFYLDRSGFGTSCMYVEESLTNKSGLVFDAVLTGSYSIAENHEKMIDTIFRDREMTAVAMAQRWGEDKLPKVVRKALSNPKERWKTFNVVHAVYPREDRNTLLMDSLNMNVASCWFMPKEKHLLSEAGYDTMPYMVSRYLKWGNSAYGWCPGWVALPAARQLNFLEKLMDGLAEIEMYPRMLIPSTLEGEVDMSAGGVTIYNPFQNAKPETWGTGGNYRAGVERAELRRQQIKDAYHVDLFRMFHDIQKQMTAREVNERAAEKLIQFSPTFARLNTEVLTPLLDRVFRIYQKQGRFPAPPPEVLAQDRLGVHVRPPKIVFKSRAALAIRALQSSGFISLLETLQPLMAIDPQVRHIINVPQAAKGLGRNFGVPEEWLASAEVYTARVQAEQQAVAAQQQAEMANNAVGTAAKLRPEQIDAMSRAIRDKAA